MPVLVSGQRPIRRPEDVVAVRQAVRQRAVELGFNLVDQTKIVTAASELARNTLQYGGGGTVRIEELQEGIAPGPAPGVRGSTARGSPNIELAMKDGYTTASGLGLGLSGAKRLSNEFAIESRAWRRHPRHDRAVAMNVDGGVRRSRKTARSDTRGGPRGNSRERLAFSAERAGQVALVVTELATESREARDSAAKSCCGRSATTTRGRGRGRHRNSGHRSRPGLPRRRAARGATATRRPARSGTGSERSSASRTSSKYLPDAVRNGRPLAPHLARAGPPAARQPRSSSAPCMYRHPGEDDLRRRLGLDDAGRSACDPRRRRPRTRPARRMKLREPPSRVFPASRTTVAVTA